MIKRIRKNISWRFAPGRNLRPPRPRGWLTAGRRSDRALTEQKMAHAARVERGWPVVSTVTRRWPE